nr:tetraspanin-18-like isoform X1 [Ipomoea batatas]GMD15566.1 tetraspanin-18-like isoform X1 [Ipomoea batatas]GMD17239.1 tetraspanin-18-like isoform X1 [Ipomoea batatas]
MGVCKWIGIVVIIIQASTLLLAIILRGLVNQQVGNDIEGDNDARERTWEPLLDPCVSQTPGLAKGNDSAWHSEVWSSRMRVKVLILLHSIKHQHLIDTSFYHSG